VGNAEHNRTVAVLGDYSAFFNDGVSADYAEDSDIFGRKVGRCEFVRGNRETKLEPVFAVSFDGVNQDTFGSCSERAVYGLDC
jgi:hypothetical protein